MRADVSRNRRQILEVARQMFADAAVEDVQLDDIAVAAGVGRTTLFRHIGSKEELVHALYRERVEQVVELADLALAYDDPYEGFTFMLRNLVEWLAEDRNLLDYTQRSRVRMENLETTREIEEAIGPVLDRSLRAGVLWAEIRAHDILALISFALRHPDPGDEGRWYLYTEILLRGVCAPRPDQAP